MADMSSTPPSLYTQGSIPPEVAVQIGKMVKDAFNAVYNTPPAWHKGEATGMKNEINGVVTAFQAVKVEWTAFKFEPPSIWEMIQQRRAEGRGEAPHQLKKLGKDAHELATQAKQAAAKAQEGLTGLETKKDSKAQDDSTRNKVNTLQREVNNRITTVRGELERRIAAVSQQNRQQTSPGNTDTKKLRDEAERTRKAARDLESAVRGTSSAMRQFPAEANRIEQSLR